MFRFLAETTGLNTLHQPAPGGESGSEAGIERQREVQCWVSDTV